MLVVTKPSSEHQRTRQLLEGSNKVMALASSKECKPCQTEPAMSENKQLFGEVEGFLTNYSALNVCIRRVTKGQLILAQQNLVCEKFISSFPPVGFHVYVYLSQHPPLFSHPPCFVYTRTHKALQGDAEIYYNYAPLCAASCMTK